MVKFTYSKVMVLSERPCLEKHMQNIKTLSLRIRKVWPMLQFFKRKSNVTFKITYQNVR